MTSTPSPVVRLAEHRERRDAQLRAAAAAPVRHVPAELLDALQGSWGTPEDIGLRPARRLRVV